VETYLGVWHGLVAVVLAVTAVALVIAAIHFVAALLIAGLAARVVVVADVVAGRSQLCLALLGLGALLDKGTVLRFAPAAIVGVVVVQIYACAWLHFLGAVF